MSKGYDLNQEHLAQLNSLGRELTRRAKSKCEFCENAGRKLVIYEVIPHGNVISSDTCIFICEDCLTLLKQNPKTTHNKLRFLSTTVWSETPIIKAFAIYHLQQLTPFATWATELLETVYIDEATQAILDEIR